MRAGTLTAGLLWLLIMVKISPFAAVRPAHGKAAAIAAVPYDVVTADEAREIIEKNPDSFLRVSRSDAELPDIPSNDDRVYQRAKENFQKLLNDGDMKKDPAPALYVYRVQQNGDMFLGLCCCLETEDYRNNNIRRHEHTRYDKEEDRTRHIEAVKSHNGPVVLLYRNNNNIHATIDHLISGRGKPDAEVRTSAGGIHQIFCITDPAKIKEITHLFSTVPNLYIADGHHRAKSAVNVADRRREKGLPYEGEVGRFMGVMFAHDRVRIHGYSRLLTDLGTFTPDTFISHMKQCFDIRKYTGTTDGGYNITPDIADPEKYHVIHMYLRGTWYECTRPIDQKASTLENLDVAVLQKFVLEDMLHITDPRGDARLQYLGGARPVADLEKQVDNGTYQVAFAMQPVRVGIVLDVADAHNVMPPKSTWFEPKLLSGLVIHTFE